MTSAQQTLILINLRGTECVCGARKTARQSFCRRHYFGLPLGMRERLYEEIPAYYEHFEAACDHHGLDLPKPTSSARQSTLPFTRAETGNPNR